MWKTLRVTLLLAILAGVAVTAWMERERSVSWTQPLWVGVFPLPADDSEAAADFVAALTDSDFAPIARFLQAEGERRGLTGELIRLQRYASPRHAPPTRPASSGPVANLTWSLRLRWYAWRRASEIDGPPPHVRLFVVYHDPARTVKVPHSAGLRQGLIGVVHAFARRDQQGGNGIVIAHELLHTLGASDKYDDRDLPVYPDGYADPAQVPRWPQRRAEVMAGRRSIALDAAEMPDSLREVVVGEATAREIRWLP